jgi:hypothetical protein
LQDDPHSNEKANRRFYARATSPKSDMHLFSGSEHGSDLLHGANASVTANLIKAFIRSVT